ncbi:MAG: hypothetical protein DSZ12_00350 [Sulfurovum sp.]|nr:MAG: hypothetical protein DSZ12_00350 [Sulfurovum sp.]
MKPNCTKFLTKGNIMSNLQNVAVYIGTYSDLSAVNSDYKSVIELRLDNEMSDVFDAAIIKKTDLDNVLIIKKYESPTIEGGLIGGGVGLVAGLLATLFPELAVTEAMVGEASALSAAVGATAGHLDAGMSRSDLKDIGNSLQEGEYALIVTAMTDVGDRIEAAMSASEQYIQKKLNVDMDKLNKEIDKALNS